MEIKQQSDTAREAVDAICSLIGCGCMLFDSEANIVYSNGSCDLMCPASNQGECTGCHRYAAYQAERFGGKYIYFCPAGLMFAVACIASETDSRSLVAGPIMATDRDNFIQSDLTEPYNDAATDALDEFIMSLKQFEPKQATYISDILLASADRISGYEYKNALNRHEKDREQKEINDYIQNIKSQMLLGINGYTPYPYEKEKKLTYAIMTGNEQDARKYLNEILGYIFFKSADNLEAIKMRAMELTVLISRAALDGGADNENIRSLNMKFVTSFMNLASIDEICFALTKMLNEFTAETFTLRDVKHVDIISKAVSFIRANYMHKITLDDVAENVFISPSYLSKIFKDEMKMNFNNYLNQIRIEKSKILLRSEQLSIIEVSELVGFFDQSYFNKVFKKLTGTTPKKYREQKGGEA